MKWMVLISLGLVSNIHMFAQIGKVGINTTAPAAMLHVKDSSVVFSGSIVVPSNPGNPPVIGAGSRMMWYSDKNAFRAGMVTGIGADYWNRENTGSFSTAMGYNPKANGNYSTALGFHATSSGSFSTSIGESTMASAEDALSMGRSTTASGLNSTAIGFGTTASGDYSTAMGKSTMASGQYSFAFGNLSKATAITSISIGLDNDAKCYAGTVVGLYNDITAVGNSSAIDPVNRIFQIGNGTADNARKNAMTVLQNGKVGINTTLPVAVLQVKDSSVVFTGLNTLPTPGNPPVSGAGTRMMWYPDKAAFRAGHLTTYGTDFWNKTNVGDYSVAIGKDTKASGSGSVAIGYGTVASGIYSTAMGINNGASGGSSTAMGEFTTASGYASTAQGYSTYATGSYSTAMGSYTLASGVNSAAIGLYTAAKNYGGTVVGLYNDDLLVGSSSAINPNNRIFQIGNGTSDIVRRNAMTVLQNGRVGINILAPTAMLHVKDSSVLFSGALFLPQTAGNPPATGLGIRMMWYPDKSAFRVGTVEGNGWDKNNIGDYSMGLGYDAKATGTTAIALGGYTTASGAVSTAMGNSTVASGLYSTAMGNLSKASGNNTTSIGLDNDAKCFAGAVVGLYNDITAVGSSTAIDPLNRIFQIGNGTASGARNNAMTVLQNGNIGIGVTSPSYLLNFPASLGDKISLWGTGANHYGFGVQSGLLQIYSDVSSTDVAFGYGSSSSFTETMRIKGNGNVGIGTSVPSLLLHVAKNTSYGMGSTYAIAATNATNPNKRLNLGYDGTIDAAIIQASEEGVWFNKKLLLNPNDGNVGIGITSPEYKLDVGGRIRLQFGQGETAGVWLNKNDNSNKLGFIGTYDDNYIGMYGETGAVWGLLMNTNNGNVGIGGIFSNEKLAVSGNGYFTGTVTASCGVLVCSDIRYKKNILPVTNALASLQSLHGIYYNWDNEKFADKNFGDERQIGFSAQELELQYPEMVKTDADGYKAVDYSRLTPVLVEALKEQQSQIDQLKEQVDNLMKVLSALKISE